MDRSQHLDAAREPRGRARPRMAVTGCLAAIAVAAVAACGADDDLPRTGECRSSATDEPAAAAMAAACGGRIEIESERTEYSQVYLEPSGHHTIEIAAVPQRARQLDGTWGPIETPDP